MKYNPKLGMWGNVDKALKAVTEANREISNTKNDTAQLDARVSSAEEVNNITFVALAETKVLDDNTAARHAEVFEEWCAGVYYEAGKMRRDPLNGKLYRVRDGKAHTSDPGWNPSIMHDSWVLVDVTHAGTMDDPIIAGRGMEYVEGLYYFDEEDGKLYLCTRSGTLHYMPHELVGQYFLEVTA